MTGSYQMGMFEAQLQRLREDIRDYGRADAHLTFDGRDVSAKVFDITADGNLDCKEYSGCEFSIHLDELDNIEVEARSPGRRL
jgi:hypothetical protein